MSIAQFGDWLYATPISTAIRATTWIIPNVQALHILAITVIVGSALATELRLAGVFATDRRPADLLNRFLPWMRWALIILLITGSVLVLAEPGRTLGNVLFWTKMVLVAGASIVTLWARTSLLRGVDAPADEATLETSRPLAWLMLLIWCAVIFCGRFIAYT